MARVHADVLLLQPPSPPYRDVLRDYAGGFGVAFPSARAGHGHDGVTQPYLPLVYALAQARAAGLDAAFLDAQAERLSMPETIARVSSAGPSVIVGVVNLPSLAADLAALATLKEITGAKIVAVGTTCRVLPAEVLAGDVVDFAVRGDLEVALVPLLQALASGQPCNEIPGVAVRGSAGAETPPLGSLDDLPLPPLDLLPWQEYRTWEFGRSRRAFGRQFGPWPTYFPLYLSRGCPHRCRYCPYPVGYGSRRAVRSPERAVEEFAAVAAKGIRHVLLRDQLLVQGDEERLAEFCMRMIRARLGVDWLCEARPGSLSDALLGLMRKAGCVRIHYGVETADPETFEREAKPGASSRSLLATLRATEESGIHPAAHFLLGFPSDTWETVRRTLDFIRDARLTSADCAILTPYPGTAYHAEMVAEGRLLARSWEQYSGTESIVHVDAMSAVELTLARWLVLQAAAANRRPGLRARLTGAATAVQGRLPESVEQVRAFAREPAEERNGETQEVLA